MASLVLLHLADNESNPPASHIDIFKTKQREKLFTVSRMRSVRKNSIIRILGSQPFEKIERNCRCWLSCAKYERSPSRLICFHNSTIPCGSTFNIECDVTAMISSA
eukprot:944062_1